MKSPGRQDTALPRVDTPHMAIPHETAPSLRPESTDGIVTGPRLANTATTRPTTDMNPADHLVLLLLLAATDMLHGALRHHNDDDIPT